MAPILIHPKLPLLRFAWLVAWLIVTTWDLHNDHVAAHAAPNIQTWIVELHPQVSASLLPPPSQTDASITRALKRQQVASFLEARARPTQQRVEEIIVSHIKEITTGAGGSADGGMMIQVDKLWIQNTLIIRLQGSFSATYTASVDSFLMGSLRWLPGVSSVERDGRAPLSLIQPTQADEDENEKDSTLPQKNIRLVHAPEVWQQANLTGKDVTIASIDSGVRYTHETLRASFRGNSKSSGNVSFDYSFWFPSGTNMSNETPDTADQVGHGTHTMGTACGSNGIGIAPGATWIAARAFDIQGAVSKSDFLKVMQWVLCPTKLDGSAKNCSLGADIITGSFGVDRGDVDTYKQWTWITHILQVWRAAGSFPVFASGNTNGFKCGSVYYPASREESVAVGALIGGSTLWGASGKGPSDEKGVVKPDFVAPGAAIRSALSVSDTSYTRMTGTSMATPHVTGMLALLLSGRPPHNHHAGDAEGGDILQALQQTAMQKLSKPFLVPSTCGGTKYDHYPNNIYGYGLPNVCAAVHSALGVKCESNNNKAMKLDGAVTPPLASAVVSVE